MFIHITRLSSDNILVTSLIDLQSEAMDESTLNSPALDPPEGIVPVFNPPPNENDIAFEAIAACMAIELAFSVSRIYTRIVFVKKVRLEDCESADGPFDSDRD